LFFIENPGFGRLSPHKIGDFKNADLALQSAESCTQKLQKITASWNPNDYCENLDGIHCFSREIRGFDDSLRKITLSEYSLVLLAWLENTLKKYDTHHYYPGRRRLLHFTF